MTENFHKKELIRSTYTPNNTILKSIRKFYIAFFGLPITSSFFMQFPQFFWQSTGITECFMISEKYFGKNKDKCEKNEKENLQLL